MAPAASAAHVLLQIVCCVVQIRPTLSSHVKPAGSELNSPSAAVGGKVSPYIDPSQFTATPWGYKSHYTQPWRAWQSTVPTSLLLHSAGTVMGDNCGANCSDLKAQMLAKHGITKCRIETGWGTTDWKNRTQIDDDTTTLKSLVKHGIRPLLLLNAHHAAPGPTFQFSVNVTVAAKKGDRELTVDNVTHFKLNFSGLTTPSDGYKAASRLVTAINGNTVTFSKPLLDDVPVGLLGPGFWFTTLAFRPFSKPGEWDFPLTMAGCSQYPLDVAKWAATALGTVGQADVGFDLEIWNEITFGSDFLDIDNYYSPPLYPDYMQHHGDNGCGSRLDPHNQTIGNNCDHMIQAVVDTANAHPEVFSGAKIINGFANEPPWFGCSETDVRIHGFGHHPYPQVNRYPERDEYVPDQPSGWGGGIPVDALHNVDTTGWSPTYDWDAPEYFATALQMENLERDLAPINNTIGNYSFGQPNVVHGYNSRLAAPCPMWITEINLLPWCPGPSCSKDKAGDDIAPPGSTATAEGRAAILHMKAKIYSRCVCLSRFVLSHSFPPCTERHNASKT